MDLLPSVDLLRDNLVAHDRAIREIIALGKKRNCLLLGSGWRYMYGSVSLAYIPVNYMNV